MTGIQNNNKKHFQIKARLKRTLSEKGLICGTHVTMNDPAISEILGYVGFDYLWLDTEHTGIDYMELLSHICFARQTDTPVFVRVHKDDNSHTKRVLEMGVDGIIFPMINTAAEAAYAMESCLYPPLGFRGFAPRRAIRYGFDDVNEYIHNESMELNRFIQIETETAVRNLPEIIGNPHIDGYIFGPCDLSNSVGEHNQAFGSKTVSLVKEAIEILKTTGKFIGISLGSTDINVIARWRSLGINMISAGVDSDYLLTGAEKALKALNAANE